MLFLRLDCRTSTFEKSDWNNSAFQFTIIDLDPSTSLSEQASAPSPEILGMSDSPQSRIFTP